MKYEEPNLRILALQQLDIITLSGESGGDGNIVDEEEGGWG